MQSCNVSQIDQTLTRDHFGAPRRATNLATICWRQWRAERELKRRGIDFRTTHADDARAAYASMTPLEFVDINGRQAWANRRTIIRSFRGLLPERPVTVLDLGSGIGSSTAVLAEVMPVGSTILGIEFAWPLVEIARSQTAALHGEREQTIAFVVGSVCETYCDADGQALGDESVDFVNASGIIGHHLDPPDAERAVDEITRVLRPQGIAALDVGPRFSARALASLMSMNSYRRLRRTRSNFLDRTGQLVFQKP